MHFITAADAKLKKRKPDSHKGDNGRVLVVAGSIDYVGAAYLAGRAAFRSGADAVVVAAPEKVAWAINCLSPDFITKKFKGDFFTTAAIKEITGMSKKFDVTLIGNGIGKSSETLKFAAAVCTKIKGPKVIDADAIAAVRIQDVQNAMFTPHHAEYDLLLRNSNCSGELRRVRGIIGSNILLVKGYSDGKGRHIDAVISKNKVAYNRTGNAGMTVGGTGDVLAGLAAGLLAQEKDSFKAAAAAAYVNGKAGDLLLRKYGWGFTATDLVEKIPEVLKQLWKRKTPRKSMFGRFRNLPEFKREEIDRFG
ncbi:NAD(P)H-hydrate dehydratase [Candidatus Woesearchaeota archaeon]|nr:NAD(P)H-hydrate dehydratase [Candidatus Woesearchaeota archaeon]